LIFFAKAPNNRLVRVVDRLTASNRYSSIKDSFILESVVVAHEILHGVYKNKESGIVLKLDYEKAYDMVS